MQAKKKVIPEKPITVFRDFAIFFRQDICFSGLTFLRGILSLKVSLNFWKKTDLLIPVMAHFEKKKNVHLPI
jgi:hypothetical protein